VEAINSPINRTSAKTQEQNEAGDSFELSISSDEMRAYFLLRDRGGFPKPSWDEIKTCLDRKGICFGLREDVLKDMLENGICNQSIEIAQGQAPIPSEDAKLELNFENSFKGDLIIGEHGRVDFREWNIIRGAEPGQVLAQKSPPVAGKFGMTVTGKKVIVPPEKDIKLPVGLNTEIDPTDSSKLICRIEGAVIYKNERVHVQPLQVLEDNVDYTTGSINFVGSLVVPGNIKRGFSVTLDGNLQVEGNAEDADLRVGGDILIKKGFIGTGKGSLDCRGKIVLGFIENQFAVSGESILVGGEIINAHLSANNVIKAVGPKGVIVGGDCTAGKSIEAEVLGDKEEAPTKIRAACDHKIIEEYREVEYELDETKQSMRRAEAVLYNFEKMQLVGQLSDKDRMILNKLKDIKEGLRPKMEALEARKKDLTVLLNKNLGAKVIARQKVYPGVELRFGIFELNITDELGPTVFEVEQGKIKAREYKIIKEEVENE